MKEFNLNEALSGKPVVTRDGRPVKIAGYNEDVDITGGCVVGWAGNKACVWDYNGRRMTDKSEHCTDLFMAPTTRKEWIVRSVHKVQKHIIYCSSPLNCFEDAEYFAIGQQKNFDCTIHEITITE